MLHSPSMRTPRPFTASRPRLPVPTASAAGTPSISAENVKLRVRMRGYDVALLREAVDNIKSLAEATGVDFKGPVMLPTRRKLYCVLRSPHVDKDAREHFEVRTHHRLVDLANLSSQAVEAMMQWVPPPGLEVECSIVAAA
jgi:small subunit ribosomal protein S10